MKVTLIITDNPNGTASAEMEFSEPTPAGNKTAATRMALDVIGFIKSRVKAGREQTLWENGT